LFVFKKINIQYYTVAIILLYKILCCRDICLTFCHNIFPGLLCIVVLAECPAKRYLKMLLGHDGARIRLIAKEAEQALANTFRCGVKLKIVVTDATQSKQ
jgi:hypothetical protein